MDDMVSRMMDAMDHFQIRLSMATDNGLRIVRQYSDEGRHLAIRAINDVNLNTTTALTNVWTSFIQFLERAKAAAIEVADPTVIYEQMSILFRDEIARNNAYFILVGLGFGTTGGFLLGFWLARPHLATPIMKAVACISFTSDPDNVSLCTTSAPQFETAADILVRVKSVALNRIDKRISLGYGRTMRRMIQNYDQYKLECPLIIGRSCSGVVEAVGKGTKSGLEIGDEVWLASPWYESGTSSELVVVQETRISRKPFLIGFEGAASLPYSGCIALNLLESVGLGEHTSSGKRILIQDACSPVGCVLSQLLNKWGAAVSATCHSRSAPVIHELGAADIITFSNENFQNNCIDVNIEKSNFINELTSREKYDFIFLTTKLMYDHKFVEKFLAKDGVLIDAVEPDLMSDKFGAFMRIFLSLYVRLKKIGAVFLRTKPDWGGPHLCHMVLERLAAYVNDETLKTVVDRVYLPQEVDKALEHVCSEKSIGSTILTFR